MVTNEDTRRYQDLAKHYTVDSVRLDAIVEVTPDYHDVERVPSAEKFFNCTVQVKLSHSLSHRPMRVLWKLVHAHLIGNQVAGSLLSTEELLMKLDPSANRKDTKSFPCVAHPYGNYNPFNPTLESLRLLSYDMAQNQIPNRRSSSQ